MDIILSVTITVGVALLIGFGTIAVAEYLVERDEKHDRGDM